MELFIGQQINEKEFKIQGDEFHHCIRVTRHKTGDEILLSDFSGTIYRGIISEMDNDQLISTIQGVYTSEHPGASKITIAISLTQAIDRFEWFIEKAVENGIHEIVPLICKRTENHRSKPERWLKIIEASAKQTLRPLKPALGGVQRFEDYIKSTINVPQKFIGHCQDGLEGFLGKKYQPEKDVVMLIGPAGDFTPEEIQSAKVNGFIPVSLGEYRLRTETAGLTALQILQTIRQL